MTRESVEELGKKYIIIEETGPKLVLELSFVKEKLHISHTEVLLMIKKNSKFS